jgi:hypothetical protein
MTIVKEFIDNGGYMVYVIPAIFILGCIRIWILTSIIIENYKTK